MIKISKCFGMVSGILLLMVCLGSPFCYGSKEGRLYVLGMGPSEPDLTAPRAMDILEKADMILCSPHMQERFRKYIDPQKEAFNPWEGIHGEEAAKLRKSNYGEWLSKVEKQRKKVQDFVLQHIKNGKAIAMLDGGDPCVYGPSLFWLLDGFDDRYLEVIPGIGSFNAASAALKRPMTGTDTRFVMLTSPHALFGRSFEKGDDLLKDISKYDVTMIFYMALSSMDRLVEKFIRYYPPDLPMAIVYYAGYSEKEKVLRSTLGMILDDLKKTDEKWMGLLIIGKAVKNEKSLTQQ
ncbi:MAG: SAM-dependent methyltransferase [Thermodesulfobacteriota bacterium]|nr:SAM-dependent methyltransferase [Thermodesulfobacteriota bacterium]